MNSKLKKIYSFVDAKLNLVSEFVAIFIELIDTSKILHSEEKQT